MRQLQGFTLVEALSVLAVTAVLASVAVPSMKDLVDSTRVTAASNELLGDLLLTRSEAMKRRTRVAICKSAEGQWCTATGGWQQGWIVFEDANGDGVRGAEEPLVRRQQALSGNLRLTGTAPVARYVSYAPNGATKTVGGGFQAGTLTVCAASAGPAGARQIILNASGRPRTTKVELPSCG
ncbi:MAG TPA: GspH/FimT family pseudopilin [Ramlibacter sp.]|uniref:GspH/FimT family pseudopilin n=1 Tax=Ramlibacter sp. TaxID=1917967 RepID=UPI002ED24B07